jgi:hypothetical protein
MARRNRARGNTGRHTIFGREALIVDAVDAQRALLHDAGVFVELAGAVGTGPGAELATDAEIFVDQHDTVLGAFVGRAGRAHRDACGLGTMQARAREVHGSAIRAFPGFEGVHAVEPHAVGLGIVGPQVGERCGDAASVPLLTVHRAGMAADADIEVDDEPQPLGRRMVGQAGHERPRRKPAPYRSTFGRSGR